MHKNEQMIPWWSLQQASPVFNATETDIKQEKGQ